MIEDKEESWRQELVNDNISDNQSPIPPTGSPMPPTGCSVPPIESPFLSLATVSSISIKSDTRLWTVEEIEELIEL